MVKNCLHENANWLDGNTTFDEWVCKDCFETFIVYVENSGV